MARRSRCAGILAGILLSAAWAAFAQPEPGDIQKIRARGFAPGRTSASRYAAIQAAEREALGLYIRHEIGIADNPLLRPLLDYPRRYVQSSRVIESENADGGTRVVAEAYINTLVLRRDVAMSLAKSIDSATTFAVLVSDSLSNPGELGMAAPGLAERALADALRKAGLNVISPDVLRERYSPVQLRGLIQGDNAVVNRFCRENRAAVAIVGDATVGIDQKTSVGNTNRFRASVKFRVVCAGSGRAEQFTGEAVVEGAHPERTAELSLADAVAKSAERLRVAAILCAASAPPSSGFWVTVEAPGSPVRINEIGEALVALAGIGKVEFLRRTNEQASFRVEYGGTLQALAEGLSNRTFSDFRLDIKAAVGQEITFVTVPR